MAVVHQIVNLFVDPAFVVCLAIAAGLVALLVGRRRLGGGLASVGAALLFSMSWPPFVEATCAWLEKDYPIVRAEEYPAADAVVVLGGGVGMPSAVTGYPYPTLSEAADRVWFAALLWRAQARTNAAVKIYCSGPEASRHTPRVLASFGVPPASIRALDGPLNTEEEARRCERELAGRRVLLVTSALHMKRATRIFGKYAPGVQVIPAPTDHQFIPEPDRFRKLGHWLPNAGSFGLAACLLHELIGLLRYSF